LYPGVYIEEVAPATTLEGVATSVAAFAVGVLIGIAASKLAEQLRHRCQRT